jgi:hypothetical protein
LYTKNTKRHATRLPPLLHAAGCTHAAFLLLLLLLLLLRSLGA